MTPLRQPLAVLRELPTSSGYPHDEAHDLELAREAGVDLVFAPSADEMYPPGFQTWVEVTELGSILEGAHRPGHFRGVATVVLKLFTIVRPDARLLRPEGRPAGRGHPAADPRPRARDRAPRPPHRPRRRRSRAVLAQRSAVAGASASARSRSPARSRLAMPTPRARCLPPRTGSSSTTSSVADFDPPVLAGAVRIGSTRLIDNVVLEGEEA